MTGFLILFFVYEVDMYVCMCVFVCVRVCVCVCMCVALRLLSHDVGPHDWLDKFYSLYISAVVSIFSKGGFRIEVCHRNQPNRSKLRSTVKAIAFTLTMIYNSCT